MKEIHVIQASDANERAGVIAQRLLSLLADFDATYPDQDAADIASDFDYFTQNYVLQSCASALSDKSIVVAEPWWSDDILNTRAGRLIKVRALKDKRKPGVSPRRMRKKPKPTKKDKNLGVT